MENGLLVVFHHNHRVAGIAEALQCMNQFEVIVLVQADTRLIKDIEHPYQLGSDLGC